MKIGVDIDGVILDFERTMRFYAEYYDIIAGGNGKVKNYFSYLDNYDWNKWQKEEFSKDYLIKGTRECSLVPGSKDILNLLHSKGVEIILITARGSINKETKNEVLKVLEKFDIYYDKIYFEITDKVRICKELNIDLMIDDNPSICNSLKNSHVKTFYFKDNDVDVKENDYLVKVSNWGEILRYLILFKVINITG